MTAYCTEPTTPINFAYENKATMVFPKLKDFSFMVVGFNLPSLSLPAANRPSPFVDDSVPGDKLKFSNLTVRFLVREDFSNWIDMYHWMIGLGKPRDHTQYANKPFHREDFHLIIKSAYQQPITTIAFQDAWPTDLSSVEWSSQVVSLTPMTATVTFQYTLFKFLADET